MYENSKPFIVTMGDPAGVGGELTLAAWKARKAQALPPFFAIDAPARLKAIDSNIPIQEIETPVQALEVFDNALPVLPLSLAHPPQAGVLDKANSAAVIESIQRAVEYCLNGQAAGVITNPIHKAALYEAGFTHPGHTEFVADICSRATGHSQTPVMMLVAQDLCVVPLTVHIPLCDVPQAITVDLIMTKARIIDASLKGDFGLSAPRIAVAGLNPHAGEGGTIGIEDRDILAPAIAQLRSEGIAITGPHPADTLFHLEARAQYDIALGMYHDQALIPLKTLDFYGGVNCTLGLSVIRTSPDHGTALDIAGKGIARAESFINAIKMAAEIAGNRN